MNKLKFLAINYWTKRLKELMKLMMKMEIKSITLYGHIKNEILVIERY